MNARFINLGQARKVDGTELGDLKAPSMVALAIAQAIGTGATRTASEAQAWRLTATKAVEIQEDFKDDTTLRAQAWKEFHDAAEAELRGKIVAELVAKMGLAKDVKQGKAKDNSPLTSLQSLLVKAQTKLDNYTQRVSAAWEAGLVVKYDTGTDGAILPEASGKLQDRTRDAKASQAVKTPDSEVKAAAGQLAGNITGLASDFSSQEQADAIKALLTAVNAVVLRYSAGILSTEELNDTSAQLLAFGAENTEVLQPMPKSEPLVNLDESAEADEVREELGIEAAA